MRHLTSTYGIHPSDRLVRLFSTKPYQGVDPSKAKILIIGNDANYSPEITHHEFFRRILDYHADGVRFWKMTGVHHPFMLADYPYDRRKGGVRYHLNFSKLNFSPAHAEFFSFVELLHLPTIGNTGSNKELFFQLLDSEHLNWLESLALGGDPKFVLVNQTLAKSINRISKKMGVLKELAAAISDKPVPAVALKTAHVTIYNGYSFSHSVSDEYLGNLASLMRAYIEHR